jgi:hypothetical protein
MLVALSIDRMNDAVFTLTSKHKCMHGFDLVNCMVEKLVVDSVSGACLSLPEVCSRAPYWVSSGVIDGLYCMLHGW